MKTPSLTLATGILALTSFAPATIHGQQVEKQPGQPAPATQPAPQGNSIPLKYLAFGAGALVIVLGNKMRRDHHVRNCTHDDIGC